MQSTECLNSSSLVTGLNLAGGDDLAIGAAGSVDDDITDVHRCGHPDFFDRLHDIEDTIPGDGPTGPNADQGNVAAGDQDVAGDGPYGMGEFLLRPGRTLVA